MSFPWPLQKLDIIQGACALTGDVAPAVANDGSDIWNIASPGYDRAIAYMIESHGWGFAILTIVLTPSPTPPQDTDFDTAYPLPSDCVHVNWIKLNMNNPNTSNQPYLTLWKIFGTPTGPIIAVNSQGGPPPPLAPVTPAQVTMQYVSNSGALTDSTNGTSTFVLALEQFVAARIYSGYHEDFAQAKEEWAIGVRYLQEARTRYDQQKPKRQFFNSRIGAVRRIRKPWPQLGINNWGSGSGGGMPG
jgi:hypothetical protein